ncbi:unnamed protein product [Bathycoccus prasinos]
MVWEKYQEQFEERNGEAMDAGMYIEEHASFAVGEHDPYFLAEVFIQTANELKTNRIKLTCESSYVFDVNKYPPKPLPKTRPRWPHENRFENALAGARRHDGRGAASVVVSVTINLHVSIIKFYLIGTTQMT